MEKTQGEILNFDSISALLRYMGFDYSQESDFHVSKIEGYFGDEPVQSPFFRTGYFVFLLITEGAGNYTIDNVTFHLEPMTFYFTTPYHVKSYCITKPWRGYIISVAESFIRQHYRGDLFLEFPFLVAQTTPPLNMKDKLKEEFCSWFTYIMKEYEGSSTYKYQIISNQLIAFLFKLKDILLEQHIAEKQNQYEYSRLIIQFRAFIDEHFNDIRKKGCEDKICNLNEVAEKLNVNPNYLGRLIKTETGKSFSQWMSERIIAESKAMLSSTHLSVSEICFNLKFEDSTYFTKYFKRYTGLTPKEFRENSI